jgi:hypothetical protein
VALDEELDVALPLEPAPVDVFLSLLHAATTKATPINAATTCRRRPLVLLMHILHGSWTGRGD